jgi:hypothetical protein
LISTKVAIPRRKVTMATLDSISQRRRGVVLSGNILFSVIWTHGYFLFGKKLESELADRLLSVWKKVNIVHE